EESSVSQAQCVRRQPRNHLVRESSLAGTIAAHLSPEHHVRTVLQQGDEAKLRKARLATRCYRSSERSLVLLGVGHIQNASVENHQTPSPVPRSHAGSRGQRTDYGLVQISDRLPPEPL